MIFHCLRCNQDIDEAPALWHHLNDDHHNQPFTVDYTTTPPKVTINDNIRSIR